MMKSTKISELKAWRVSASEGTFSTISGNRHERYDVNLLATLGKKQQLKRRFGFLSLFGFSCTILATWETLLALFQQAFTNGGPAGLAWGFPIAWLLSTSVYMVLAELASIAPIAGGQYFWVAILAPRRYQRFLSYFTGWLTSLAWIATVATGMVFVGTMVQGLVILNYEDTYVDKAWHGTLLSWAIIAVAVFVNTVAAGLLPFLEGVILLLHIMSFIAIMISLLYLCPSYSKGSDVFFKALNGGNWPSQGLSFCIGFIGNVGTFVGADAAVHMSEEIDNAAKNVPRAILTTLILNGSTGYGMLIAILFCIQNTEAVLNTDTGFPFIQIFHDATGVHGATAMTSLIIALLACAVIGFLATASRMVWSFARDKGLPFHKYISKVNNFSSVPVVAVCICTIIPCLLALIYLGNPTAYEDVVSLSVSGLYASYFIPCSLMLWRRVTGKINPYDPTLEADAEPVTGVHALQEDSEMLYLPLSYGPWRLPGAFGILNNMIACVYILFVLFWDFWPAIYPATAQNMNYSVLILGSVMIFSISYYLVKGRHEYKGPLVDREIHLRRL